jgi:thiol-disulfide isomerase/thioredoxin
MLPFSHFEVALPHDEFLAKHGTPADQERWKRGREKIVLSDEQTALLKTFTRRMPVLVLAGAWCGDCAGQCPVFEAFAAVAPVLEVRYLDRDAHPAVQEELKINGGNRVPVAVFFSEDGYEVARYGERTLTAYRKLVSGVVALPPGVEMGSVVGDWLREFERSQWILRLSPRLRRLHTD